ncbi:MAG TPA: hypothetical protein DDE71_05925 [Tenacibaculum sp.]|nr:hypothetical protein [Tenacibaculum sp.]
MIARKSVNVMYNHVNRIKIMKLFILLFYKKNLKIFFYNDVNTNIYVILNHENMFCQNNENQYITNKK